MDSKREETPGAATPGDSTSDEIEAFFRTQDSLGRMSRKLENSFIVDDSSVEGIDVSEDFSKLVLREGTAEVALFQWLRTVNARVELLVNLQRHFQLAVDGRQVDRM